MGRKAFFLDHRELRAGTMNIFKFIDGILDILHWYRGDDDFGLDLNRFETPSQKVLKYW